MKRILGMIGALAALASHPVSAASLDELRAAVREDMREPVRPGGVNGQAFWNANAIWFLYPPAFDFKPLKGATAYRFRVYDAAKKEYAFTAAAPTATLAPVWADVPTGPTVVSCDAIKNGKAQYQGQRKFYKMAPFEPGGYGAPPRSFADAARLGYDYLLNLPQNKHFVETGKPSPSYTHNCYPSKIHAAVILSVVKRAASCPAQREAALKLARVSADYLLKIALPEGTPLAGFTPTYEGRNLVAGKYAGQNMLDYPCRVGSAFLALYKATGERKYFEGAARIAETYVRLQGTDGTWYLKMWEKDGKPVNPNRLHPLAVIDFMDEMFAETKRPEFQKCADRAFAFVEKGPLADWNWEGQFEDVEPTRKYVNLTKHPACDTAIRMLRRWPGDPKRIAQARELLRFAEDQFVCWRRPFKETKRSLPGTRWTEWCAEPGAVEQYYYRENIDASVSKLIETYLAIYRVEKKPLDLAKAQALGASLVKAQKPSGRIPTVLTVSSPNEDWLNCMVSSFAALDALAEVADAGDAAAAHAFQGAWITDAEMAAQTPRPFKARELKRHLLPPEDKKLCNRHILFRRAFDLAAVQDARVFITADDYYKLYVNGVFAGQGPAAGMVEHTYYNEIDVTRLLKPGRNVLAVHTYYQGLVNRVWVSGDRRHGLLLDLVADGRTVVASGTDFKTARHTGYAIADNDNGWCGRRGTVGYDTQFLERYDAAAPEVGFAAPDFDDAAWRPAVRHPLGKDYRLFPQPTPSVVTEAIRPASVVALPNGTLRIDFGGVYVGGMVFAAHGPKGAEVVVKCGQELNADGSVRHRMRCNCNYVEQMLLSGGPRDVADPFDYKSFRYAEVVVPPGATVDRDSIVFRARHTPFALKAKPNFGDDPVRRRIWELCVGSFRYGVQEQIMDCMDREKGYYLGDGVYTMYAYCTLTQDWAPARRFFDDFLRTRDIDRGLVTCANCAFMQEIAEYPLMLILFARLYLEATGDAAFIRARYDELADVLDAYRERYARPDGLIANIDKWCVVEWPDNYRDGYDADVRAGKVCTDVHNAANAWYVGAVKTMNWVAAKIGRAPYADAARLQDAFDKAFWDPARQVFVDRLGSKHASMPANVYAAFFDLAPAAERAAFKGNFLKMVRAKFPDAVNMFQYMPLFFYLQREGEGKLLVDLIRHPGAWRRMLAEDATRTFEGWGRDTKWNTSLFHLTTASVAVFLTDPPPPVRLTGNEKGE